MRRPLLALAAAGSLALAACGGDDDDAAGTTAATTTQAPTTTAAATTTAAPTTAAPTTAAEGGVDPDADAAGLAWATVFDSALGFDAKAELIADADALRPTIESYTTAGDAVGGITLVPTAVEVTGDTAAITYDVKFAGQSAYSDQTGSVNRVDDVWQVSREEFCGFMAAARNPCP